MFGEAMSIFARSVRAPSGNSPAFMRANRSRFSSTVRLRNGLILARPVRRAAIVVRVLRRQIADKGLALFDQRTA